MTHTNYCALGLNVVYHESAAALIADNHVVCAIEEERLNRIKHGKQSRIDNASDLPFMGIDMCLKAAGELSLNDVDVVGVSFMPGRRLAAMIDVDAHPISHSAGFGTEWGERRLDELVRSIPAKLARLAGNPTLQERVHFISHHVAHAAAVFHASPFERAAILVVDGIGEDSTAWLGRGGPEGVTCLEEIPYPHSLGFLWERLSRFLGFDEYDAAKVMGLAAYGNANQAMSKMEQLITVNRDDPTAVELPFTVDSALAGFRSRNLEGLESLFGPRRSLKEAPELERFADIAAALQVKTEQALIAVAKRVHRLSAAIFCR